MLRRGFTLIEMMVAMGLLSVVLLFVFQTFTYQHSTYSVVDQVSEAHQTLQGAARLIERDLRNAGYMVPHAAAACGVDATDAPDVLIISDTDAIQPADLLPVELASEELGAAADSADDPTAVGSKAVSVDEVVIDNVASYDTDADGTNDSDFHVGGGAILVATGALGRGVACGIVTAVDITSPYEVTVDFLNVLGAGSASDLVLVPAHVYRIIDGNPPQLERDGTLLAKDVEDLQVAWFYDDDGDREIGTDEVRGVSGNDYDNTDVDGSDLREVRFNLVTRTRINDARNPVAAGVGQARENRDTNVPGDDGRHRRVHTATVYLRNLKL
ncbi:MAG TPA: prepilin-type N-terminal cleavage/methylation domain-containing protein [Myxococcota bacterium]|nr:prepilin-type N-terminal cleavage/methylation domain-containing protein [Myxococcota bacterium]